MQLTITLKITDIKLSRSQIKKIIQSGGSLGALLGRLAGPLMKAVIPLAKNVLVPLGLTAVMSEIDGSIQKKIYGSVLMDDNVNSEQKNNGSVTLIIANEDMRDIMKIIQALEDSGVLLTGVGKTIENETK